MSLVVKHKLYLSLFLCSDLLMHYGTVEKFSVKFYEDACNEMAEDRQEPESPGREPSYDCHICDLATGSERYFLKHLTLRHFPKQLCDDLPKKFPFRCPFIDCQQTRQNLHGLMLHYGVDHVISMELYKKHPMYRKVQQASSHVDKPSSAQGNSSRVELPAASHRPTKLQAVVTPYHPEMEVSSPGASQHDLSPLSEAGPSSVSGSSGHVTSARARILKTWQSGNLEVYRKTIEELEAKMRDMEAAHKERLKEKEKDFERWLTLKEAKLEAEVSKCRALEDALSEKDLCIGDLTAQLELVHDNFSRVEEDLEAKKKLCEDLLAFKEESLKELQVKEQERLNSYEELYQKEKQLESIEEQLQERESSIEKLSQQVREHEEEWTGVEAAVLSLQSDVYKVTSEFELKTTPSVKESKGIKVVIVRDGFTSKCTKRFKTMSSEVKDEMEPNDVSLAEEKKSLKESLEQMQPLVKGLYNILLEKEQEVSELEQRVRESEFKAKDLEAKTDVLKSLEKEKKDLTVKVKGLETSLADLEEKQVASVKSMTGLEKEKKDLLKKVKGLETTLADWETRQFTNLKLIAGLEKERDSLQAKLKEMQDGNLSHEDQLYWKDVAIKNKEKEVKSLRAELDEKVAKSAELQKEIDESASRIKALEAKNTSLEGNVVALAQEGQKKATDVEDLKKQVGNQTSEIKHLKIVLSQKGQELISINTTAVCQKAELDRLMRENEKFESDYSKAIAQLEVVKNSKKDVMKKLQMKELSLQAMKAKLAALVARDKAREEDRLEMEMRNQVLSDMDKVIQIQTKESNNTGERVLMM